MYTLNEYPSGENSKRQAAVSVAAGFTMCHFQGANPIADLKTAHALLYEKNFLRGENGWCVASFWYSDLLLEAALRSEAPPVRRIQGRTP